MKSDDIASDASFPPLLHLSFILQQLADDLLIREVGISVSQARIMSALDISRPSLQNHVAQSLSQTEANISRQLKAMKSRGLVTVEKNKKDGRARDVRLTVKGRESYERAASLLGREIANLISSTGIRTANLL
ncbi:MAG TPA: MarR family winged helix-turn-helix transcriptional regulator [Candidatus Saccharimonadales bacterium]|nr:MarR family winged helix-turn-helix transcriptional regulator [Candidatus Saccharimonadales bacterium]